MFRFRCDCWTKSTGSSRFRKATGTFFPFVLVVFGAPSIVGSHQSRQLTELVDEFKTTKIFWRQFEIGQSIVGFRDTRVLRELESWLMHDDRHQRGNAAFIFASLGDGRGFQVITAVLNDRSDRPKGQGIPGTSWSLERQIASDRYYAVHLLGRLKDARALPILVPLSRDKEVMSSVSWAIQEVRNNAPLYPLIEALRDKSPDVRVIAIRSLEKRWAYEALPTLRVLLEDGEKSHFGGVQVSVAEVASAAIKKLDARR